MASIPSYDTVITEAPFLPSVYTMALLAQADHILFEQYENYTKGTYRNKGVVRSNQNNQYLIVPLVKGKHRSQPIKMVQIAYDEDWFRIMKNRLQTEYGSFPYYPHYIEDIHAIVGRKYRYLFDLNMRLIQYFFELLEITNYSLTESYVPQYSEDLLDLRSKITPLFFKNHPGLLKRIELEYFSFIPGHTFLEVLFSYGPESRRLVDEYGARIHWSG
ncbi:WbqC family protein [Membranicola marinus]|uniref:WbqC family protein n=1 Tax=Membranihabitans marinus TaxID=1227546 RepID=A0A953L904_9BACT|nr:WbqC family protein [Membranihabitans marinus]MBY5957118.1 WbqC family protein [Membranihabitans marinus]